VHNPVSGLRFEYRELFEELSFDNSVQRYQTRWDWEGVPDGNALFALPPSDVADAQFKAEQRRSIPLSRTLDFTSGVSVAGSAAVTLPRVAAAAAFRELARIVSASLKGSSARRLEQTPASVCLELVQQSALLIRAAYGKTAGVTLVTPNDTLWTCMRGGAAARLAVRHMGLFTLAPPAEATAAPAEGLALLQTAIESSRQNADSFESFADAFVAEAKAFVQAESKDGLGFLASGKESSGAFWRVEALSQTKPPAVKAVLKAAVAASVSHLFVRSADGDLAAAFSLGMQSSVSRFEEAVFQQRVPAPKTMLVENQDAAWASRRMDTSLSRRLRIGEGAEAIVGALSAVDLDGTSEGAVFYCPVGGRLDSLPGRMPFSVDGLNARVVWIERLWSSARALLETLREGEAPAAAQAWHLDGVPLSSTSGFTGLSRSPFAVTLRPDSVLVHLSEQTYAPPAVERQAFSHDVSMRTALMRQRMFNSDRLFFGLSLTYHYMTKGPLNVTVPADAVVALAIALALREIEGGRAAVDMNVYAGEGARGALEELAKQARAALDGGCRVCPLAEVALCVN
jgi:hypothetical protein